MNRFTRWLVLLAVLALPYLAPSQALALDLTTQQKAALKADILAKSGEGQPLQALVAGNDFDGIAAWYMQTESPVCWVWRTDVTRADIYHKLGPEGSAWNWTTYKGQSVPEQGAWVQMFMGDQAAFSLPNLRAGVGAIFSGSAAQNTQRDHVLSVGRRPANRLEKLLAVSGSCTTATPSTMSYNSSAHGLLQGTDVVSVVRE